MHNVNVTFITDSNYILPTWVALRSVICSKSDDSNLKAYIIADRLSATDKNNLKLACLDSAGNQIDDVDIIFIDVDGKKEFEKQARKKKKSC